MKITPVLIAEKIEPVIPCWVDRLGFEKTVEVPGDDVANPLGRPALAQLADVLPDPLHPLMTGTVPGEEQLREHAADRVAPADQAIPIK